jgi:hypothetical protein
MKLLRGWEGLALAGVGVILAGLTGCQTNVAGMTLPSGHYLEHPPQYFPPSPPFPLTRELASMEAQSGMTPGAPAPAVEAVPPAPVPAAPPVPAPQLPPPIPGGAAQPPAPAPAPAPMR